MEYRLLGGSGLLVPILGLGTATFGGTDAYLKFWGETDVREATHLVDIALEAGVTLFDSADSYSNGVAEEILGQAIAGRRDHLLVSTKVTNRMGPGANDIGASRYHLIAACDASLRRLGTDRIDLWQMHGFDAMTPVEETMRALDDLVAAGKVRYIGCSNYSGWHLMKSLAVADRYGWARYVAHQAYYSLISRDYEWELMPLGLDQKVGAVVWSPLAGGQLTGKVGRSRPAPEGSRAKLQRPEPSLVPQEQFFDIVDALEAIAVEIGRSVAQVALNWTLHRPSVATVVVGARNETQLRDNLGALEFRLTPEQVKRLDDVSAIVPAYPYWHQRQAFAHRNPPPVGG